MKDMRRVANAKKPKVVFECPEYKISIIPLNYRIDISPKLARKNPNAGIDRDCYCDLDTGIAKVHEIAKRTIEEYFIVPLGGTFASQEESNDRVPILQPRTLLKEACVV